MMTSWRLWRKPGCRGLVMILVALVLFFRMAFRHLEERLRHGWGWIQMGAAVGAVGLFCP